MKGLAVVTGASGGIGKEIARILASEGYDLVIVARSADKLRELSEELVSAHGISVTEVAADLSVEEGRKALFDMTQQTPAILVNNAGFGDYGPFAECPWEKQDEMIRLNMLALSHITRHFLPDMISAGSGRILNVASVAAFEPGPLMSVYYASKAYVLSLSEALSVELKGTGVTVTALCPGPVNTGFSKAANAEDVSLFKKSSGADAAKVAEFAVRKMHRGKPIAVYGALFKVSLFFVKILPRAAVRRLIYRIQKSRTR